MSEVKEKNREEKGRGGQEGKGEEEGVCGMCECRGEEADMDDGCYEGIFNNYSARIPQHAAANVGTSLASSYYSTVISLLFSELLFHLGQYGHYTNILP